jgi:hypothetical protein
MPLKINLLPNFRAVKEAYEILGNETKKLKYDRASVARARQVRGEMIKKLTIRVISKSGLKFCLLCILFDSRHIGANKNMMLMKIDQIRSI